MAHDRTHVAYLPHVGKWHVYCDNGCNLGTSAMVDTLDRATARAELHVLAGCGSRYVVRRTLPYARTVYGRTNDPALATKWAERQTALGYPSEVIDTKEEK